MCSHFLYADDIILLAPSVSGLQRLLSVCEEEIEELDMKMNTSKTVCMRIGRRHSNSCEALTLRNGDRLQWVETCRYLGVYVVSGQTFCCSFDNAKKKFYSSFNCIYGRVGHFASEEVTLSLLNSKCISAMLYGTEACPVLSRHYHSFDFAVTRVFMKILRTSSSSVVEESQKYFSFLPVRYRIDVRTARFLERFCSSENRLCTAFWDSAQYSLRAVLAKYGIEDTSRSHVLQAVIKNNFFQ